ncbi:hypothetical protein Csa_005826 [Cucumis sativus]|uniref:Ubiquinol-cytochrome c reductase complex 6.7 kDa protein n=1 Tax=Cucumis sativus TaxID=3659 RepID=A0A0A0KSL8_CUCSA|nr:hypothetical protein Csa_005826 [Cucumis sativus]
MKTGEKGLLKFLHPKLRNVLHPINIEAAALWSVAGIATALWLVQPFDWLKKKVWAVEEKGESGVQTNE